MSPPRFDRHEFGADRGRFAPRLWSRSARRPYVNTWGCSSSSRCCSRPVSNSAGLHARAPRGTAPPEPADPQRGRHDRRRTALMSAARRDQSLCVSRISLTRLRKPAAYAPSNARWSQLIARLPTGWMAIASPPSGPTATTGLRTIASVEMIATCGWLMIGIVSTEPAEPLFEIVNVPPLRSRRGSACGSGRGWRDR